VGRKPLAAAPIALTAVSPSLSMIAAQSFAAAQPAPTAPQQNGLLSLWLKSPSSGH